MTRKPGLPSNFSLDVSAADFEQLPPADLGDYLDDDFEKPRLKSTATKTHAATNGEVAERSVQSGRGQASQPLSVIDGHKLQSTAPTTDAQPSPNHLPQPRQVHRGPRVQVNMRPQSQDMLDELLRIVQTYSPERNATISELFDGIIGALYEAREELDFAQVPRRGAWGSPTAKAFTDSLKTTFQRAIAINQRRRG